MMKKTIGLLAALTMTISCAGSVYADSGVAKVDGLSDSTVTVSDSEVQVEDDEQTAEQQKEQAEEFAIENEDPQYGKYIKSLESYEAEEELRSQSESEPAATSDEAGGGADILGYTNDALIHNSRFDDMDKVWGIDVSYYQYDIDWKKVKADGIDFAIIRVGYRGYGSGGQLVLDYKFKENIEGAIAAGIEVGVYFYTQAITTAEAKEEADFVIKYIKNYNLDLPVYFDMESVDYDVGRLDSANLTKAQKTKICTAFCDRIIEKGYKAGIYSNKYWLTSMIDGAALEKKYPIWLAHYTTYSDYTGLYNTWQFTGSGKVDGINTTVDVNVDYREKAKVDTTVGTVSDFTLTKNSDTATFTWSSTGNVSKYIVYKYDSSASKYEAVKTVTSKTATVTLETGFQYGYCVRPVYTVNGKNYYGKYSKKIYVSKGTVANLAVAGTTTTTVTLSWNKYTGASGYIIYRSVGTNGKYSKCGETTANSYADRDLDSTSIYSYRVNPYFTSGTSRTFGIISNSVTALTKPAKASAPTYAAATATEVRVNWTAVDGASGYQVALYDTDKKTYTIQKTVDADVLTAIISKLTAGTQYYVSVRAYFEYNGTKVYGSYSNATVCKTSPNAPTTVKATVTPTKTTLTWSASDGADSYVIYKKTDTGYTRLGSTTELTYSFADTADDLTRTYAIRAKSVLDGVLAASSGYEDQCVFNTAIPQATAITSHTAKKTSATLNWNKVSGATGYRVYKYDTSTNSYVKVTTLSGASTTSYTVTGLTAATSYKFKVKAYYKNSSGVLWSNASAAYKLSTNS